MITERPKERVYIEEWGAAFGSPYLIDDEQEIGQVGVLVEDGDELRVHPGVESGLGEAMAFVDGVRRAEAWLYAVGPEGETTRGLAGAFATGAVLAKPGLAPTFANEHVSRLAIWSAGRKTPIEAIAGGWQWEVVSTPSSDPDSPLASLQDRMRDAERQLALQLTGDGYLVVLDGPLNFVVKRDARVTGYVKTHHRRFLSPELHARVPRIRLGERTSLFSIDDRYSCYARLAEPGPHSGPWSGIVRLHLSGEGGLEDAKRVADTLCARLPRFAGVPHRDPRAPQNLQPIGALESHLKHLMGDAALATRAVRDAAFARNKS
jgi:hypothetical protein